MDSFTDRGLTSYVIINSEVIYKGGDAVYEARKGELRIKLTECRNNLSL